MKKTVCIPVIALALVFSFSLSAQAAQPETGIQPGFFKLLMNTVGLKAQIIPAAGEGDYSSTVAVAGLRGSSFSLSFSEGGLKKDVPFVLSIDDAAAVVQYTDGQGISILDGDERIAASGIFGAIECMVTTIFNMVGEILTAALSLDILGILEAVLFGVLNLVGCVFQIIF